MPILLFSRFKCSKCKSRENLEVDHNVETFSSILKKFAEEYEWTNFTHISIDNPSPEIIALKETISNAIADYHINNKVSGVVLCRNCHRLKHPSYNR